MAVPIVNVYVSQTTKRTRAAKPCWLAINHCFSFVRKIMDHKKTASPRPGGYAYCRTYTETTVERNRFRWWFDFPPNIDAEASCCLSLMFWNIGCKTDQSLFNRN